MDAITNNIVSHRHIIAKTCDMKHCTNKMIGPFHTEVNHRMEAVIGVSSYLSTTNTPISIDMTWSGAS